MAFDFATHIKRTRTALGLTQVQLAELSGIDQGDLSRIERGAIDPRLSTLQKVLDALGENVAPVPITVKSTLSVESREAVRRSAGRLNKHAARSIPVKH